MIQQSFILCAGKATRLYPITLDYPKCLLPIGDKTVLDLIINWLESQNVYKHICNTFWQSQKIKYHVSNIKKDITIIEEKELLGTFGGIVNALPFLDDIFLVVYGDTIINCELKNIIQFHLEKLADVTMVSANSDTPWTGGVIQADSGGKVIDIVEKPDSDKCLSNLVNAGVIVFNKKIIEKYKTNNFFDIAKDFLPMAIKDQHEIFTYNISPEGSFIDMGTFDNYNKLKEMYNDNYKNTVENKFFGWRQ